MSGWSARKSVYNSTIEYLRRHGLFASIIKVRCSRDVRSPATLPRHAEGVYTRTTMAGAISNTQHTIGDV